MSIKVIYNEQLISLLSSIFHPSPKEKDEFLPIIKDMKNIPNIISFINLNRSNQNNLNNTISLIFFLKNLFSENSDLIPLFIKNCIKNNTTLLCSLVDVFLDEKVDGQALTMIEDLLKNINFNVSITKNIFKYIYQQLNIFFNIHQQKKSENNQILNESILLKYLKLLNICYCDVKNENENEKDEIEKNSREDKIIRNYFYFNGINSGISIILNKTSNNINIDSPSLSEGCSIIFYANLDQELLDNYFQYVLTSKTNVSLIKLLVGSHSISLDLKDSSNITIIVDDDESSKIDISSSFKYNQWNCIILLIEPNTIWKKSAIKVVINETVFTSSLFVHKGFSDNEKIDNIILFENLIGKITSVSFFSFIIDSQVISFFNQTIYGGFYKNKLLLRFLQSIDKDYYKNVQNIDFEKNKVDNNIHKLSSNLSIALKEINKNKIISVFCPFMFNSNNNIIDDVFGVFIGRFKSEFDGSNVFSKNIKNIAKLGGINNLLPIAELMLFSLKKDNNYFVSKNLLTETTLIEYLKIIKQILKNHKESIIDINNNYFFTSLALFLEKYPQEIFTENILQIFIEICKETFRYKEDKDNSFANYRFISTIIFNEKIISKFTYENQLKIWDEIYNFLKKNYEQMKYSLNIHKIINILRYYDRNRYEKYCCKRHASLFYNEDIINPPMNSRIGKLNDLIILYIEKIEQENDQMNLYKSLALDLSPCLKKKIIQIYLMYFINDKIPDKAKEKTLNNLLNNNYFEITEYTLSVSLLDVRSEIFKLMHIIILKYKDKISKYITQKSINKNQILSYISVNILPCNIKIKPLNENKNESNIIRQTLKRKSSGNFLNSFLYKDNLLGIFEDENYLAHYFNQKIYEDDLYVLWGLLNSWITENAPIEQTPPPSTVSITTSMLLEKTFNFFKKEKEIPEKIEDKYSLLINPFVLSLCVDFLSNVKPSYIETFLSTINFFIKDKGTKNKDIFVKEPKFFHWLVDTIYFFHNKENENFIENKNLIPSIQQNSMELILQIFQLNASLKEIENYIDYIIEYGLYFSKIFKNNNNSLMEIIRITRLLLEKILNDSELYFNIKSIFCYEFMFLFRNGEELLTDDNYKPRRNSLLDSESLNKALKKKSKNDETDIKKTRSSLIYEEEEMNAIRNERGTISGKLTVGEENDFNISVSNQKIEFIPNYYYQGMFNFQHNQSETQNNKQIKKILKNVWNDYEMFSSIINYYKKNIWGAEIIFQNVKMEYNPSKGIFDSSQKLLDNYGDTKEYRNILLKSITKLVIIDEDFKNNINKINLLYLNLILLCFSINIAGVIDEEEELTQQLLEFLIFCILASININQNEDTYNYIQIKLYDTISFGLLFLKDKDETKFRELMFYIIDPFFEGVLEKGKKIFGSKKSLYRKSAIYKVFKKSDIDIERSITKLDEVPHKKGMSSSLPKKKINYEERESINLKNMKNKLKKKNRVTLYFRGNAEQIAKKIFDRVIDFYKEKKYLFKNDNKLALFYFKNEINISENEAKNIKENEIEQERKRINLVMKEIIAQIFSEIKKSSISSHLEEKKRRNYLKKIKKSLFSWNGFWSDKTLFLQHLEYLKYKIKNHLCKDMSKILLSPILDLKYYLPNFSKFDSSNLFNKEDYNYNICLDVDEILNINDELENQNNNNEYYIKDNKNHNFNYLESLYKSQYNDIWDIYYSNIIEENNVGIIKRALNSKEVFELLFPKNLNAIIEENPQVDNLYKCCIVKPTHHIKGYVITENKSIKFIYCPENESKELLEKDPNYDKDMGACFGSTFKTYYKDKDIICLEIKYSSIEYMFIRNYFYQETGLELFTYEKKSYFLNFKSNKELLKFIQDIIQNEKFRKIKCHGLKGKKLIGYCKLFNIYLKKTSHYIGNKMEEWQNHNISTFEYIMWLNIFAGRSFNDLTQYPVFPWIITNYQSDELDENNDFRNLNVPVGMFDFNEKAEIRKETFIEFYNTLKNELKESSPDFDYEEFLDKFDSYLEHYNNKKSKNNNENNQNDEENIGKMQINQLPYYYGSHYSNPTYVSHYLTRLFPHASISIEIHGDKFDDPNRMFFSMARTFETASTLKDDIRELIPEFFILPEMFLNKNNFNLSQDKLDSEGQKIEINDVELPPWSNNRCTTFVVEMRKNLENNRLKINKWVDLIFGYLQKGKKAEENHNIFMLNTYENIVKIENIKEEDEKNALMRLAEVGVTPIQLLTSESKARNDINQTLSKSPYSYSKGPFLSECTELKSFNINMNKYQKIMHKLNSDYKPNKESEIKILPRLTAIKAINKNELKIFTNCSYWFHLKFSKNEKNYTIEESSLTELFNISSKYAPSYQMSNIKIPIIIFGQNKYVIKGGFWDGRIEINCINNDSKEEKDNYFYSVNVGEGPVISIEISKDESILLCGTLYGALVAYQIEYINNNTNINLNLIKKLYDHTRSINSISINENLNIIASSANDYYVYIYLFPTFEIFREIKVYENNLRNDFNEDELLVANNVFLSYSPLPCISIFINSKRVFRSFTINGEYISENQESNNSNVINCYKIFNNLSFCDFIIYGTDDGMVKIRSFPDMNLINCYSPFEGCEVLCLEISFDKRFCYAWSRGGEIAVIRDVNVNDPTEVEQKKYKFK